MLKYPVERVICLSEETVEIIYLLGKEEKIVGVTGYAIRPKIVRSQKPRISSFISAKVDKILKLHPDIVLTLSDVQADLSKELISAGLNVLCFNQREIKEIYSMINIIGSLLCCSDEAKNLVSTLKENLSKITIRSSKNKRKPKIFFEEWDDPIITGIRWVSELIKIGGGIDIFDTKSRNFKSIDRVVNPQEIVDNNPDIIIASWCGKKINTDKIRNREKWHEINAIKNNHIYEIKSPLILQPGPAALTEGIKEIEKIISFWQNDKKYKN